MTTVQPMHVASRYLIKQYINEFHVTELAQQDCISCPLLMISISKQQKALKCNVLYL